MRIAILSTDKLPKFLGDSHPMEASLFAEDDLLISELKRIGVSAERLSWRAQGIDWTDFEAVVIRSTWDYIDSPKLFFATLERIEKLGVRIINPIETVRWNSDKRYLEVLEKLGLPVVPTCFLGLDSEVNVPPGWFSGESKVVLKPTVGVGGYGVRTLNSPMELTHQLSNYDRNVALMAQPFLQSVSNEGEWSFIFGADELLYSVLKKPAAGDYRVQVMYGATTKEKPPSDEDREIAKRVATNLPVTAFLKRVDMARLVDGTLALMEVELIEPQLYLFDVPEAAKKLACVIKRSLDAR